MLTLLPICDLEKQHIHIHTTCSSEKIANLENFTTSKVYLTFCEKDMEYSILQNSKSSVLLAKFDAAMMDECVKLCASSASQIKLAGIEVFWRITSTGQLQLEFYVNSDKVIDKVEDSDEMLNQINQNWGTSIINKFLFFTNPSLYPTFNDFDNRFTSAKNHFQRFFDELEKMTKRWVVSENYEIREDLLNCQLMEYQKKTVKWMIEKEMRPEKVDLNPVLRSVKLVSPTSSNSNQSLFYYPVLGLFTKTDMFHSISAPRGGILADEMGLGKTVEVLSLIVSHQKGGKVFQNESTTSSRKCLDWEEYRSMKNCKKSSRSAAIYTVTPEEMKNEKPGSYRKCEKCEDLCELEKCGWKVAFDVEFWCPQCMETKTPLEVKTTLIVLPESLMVQWYNEITKHCSDVVKVMFYFGLNKTGYLHPLEIAKFDIILTTYSTLTTEMDFTDFQNRSGPRLARLHKFSPTSLTHVKWWRLVCDEAQLVEGASNRAAQMCTKIESHHRWCMTSTPIVRSIADLGGLFRIIGLWPFNVEQFWEKSVVSEFMTMIVRNKDLSKSFLLQIASQVIRRSTKKTVQDQLQLPKLVQIEKVVKFTKTEESHYRKQMDGLRKSVKSAIGSYEDDILVNSISGKEKIFFALAKLKTTLISCGEHTNVSKRKNANEQVMCEPKNVLFRLIRAKKDEIEKILEYIIYAQLFIAELRVDRDNMLVAAKKYDQIADIILMIQELNKYFAQIVDPEKLPADSIDSEPPQKTAKLNIEQDKVRLTAELKARTTMMKIKDTAMLHISFDSLALVRFFGNLKNPLLSEEGDAKRLEVIEKLGGSKQIKLLKTEALDAYWRDQHNILEEVEIKKCKLSDKWKKNANKQFGMEIILKDLENFYEKTKSTVLIDELLGSTKTTPLLMEMPFWPIFNRSEKSFEDGELEEKIVSHEHDNQKTLEEDHKKPTSAEVLCEMNIFVRNLEALRKDLLEDYSDMLFYLVEVYPPHSSPPNLYTINCEHKKIEITKKVSSRVRHMETYEMRCLICRVLYSLAYLKFAIGSHEKLKKFFSMVFKIEQERDGLFDGSRELGEFFEYIDFLHQTGIHIQSMCDTIIDCSNKLREYYEVKRESEKQRNRDYQLPKEQDNTIIYLICQREHYFCDKYKDLMTACQELRYLIKLYEKDQSEGSNMEDDENCCPICYLKLELVANFPCGHKNCENCYEQLRKRQQASADQLELQCVTCRKTFEHEKVIFGQGDVGVPGMVLSVKLEDTIHLMKEIIEEDSEKNKILLFTTMELGTPIWRFLTKVLQKAKMPFVEVNRLNFTFPPECRILLCSLAMCSNGLSLTQANHIIFLDPSHSISEVEQAIGRINRYGQMTPMKVYHMLVEGSIDEKLREIAKNDGEKLEEEENQLTVGQLRQIFGIIE